jgi:UDP-2-acetamido-3-amino-2,3-dideoxy-glucuronate N-acetyltransferase
MTLKRKTSYFCHKTSIVDSPCQIGEKTKIWHFSHIMPNCIIGKNCTLGQNVFVSSNVVIGDNTRVQNNVSLFDGVTCAKNVFIGPSVVFTNVINPRSEINRRSEFRRTQVKEGSTIGANATIICGISLGEYSFIAAGSVVTKDVLPYALVMGNPSRQVGWVSKYGNKLKFDSKNIAICNVTKQKYFLEENSVKLIK